jgi:hypothetical protein
LKGSTVVYIPRQMSNEMSKRVAAIVVEERNLAVADAKFRIAVRQHDNFLFKRV